MRNGLRTLAVAMLLSATFLPEAARADGFVDALVSRLGADGYERITISRTFLGRTRVKATGPGQNREIIMNPNTGEILRDVWEQRAGGESDAERSRSGGTVRDNREKDPEGERDDDDRDDEGDEDRDDDRDDDDRADDRDNDDGDDDGDRSGRGGGDRDSDRDGDSDDDRDQDDRGGNRGSGSDNSGSGSGNSGSGGDDGGDDRGDDD